MSFISSRKNKVSAGHGKKLPPIAAFGHYSKKQGSSESPSSPQEIGKPLIEMKDLSISYEGQKVIDSLSLSVSAGDYLCVVGENGSGKSSLMNVILGLTPLTDGKLIFHSLKKNQIGVLPQQSLIQSDFPALVGEIVRSGCLNRSSKGPFMSRESKNIAFANMERLGITSLEKRSYRDLSGGQQQRVMLARALCAAEKLLILDEPVAGLDPKATADIYALIDDLNKRQGMTVIMVSHDVRAALKYSTHVLRINKGSTFYGTAEDFKALPEIKPYLDTLDEIPAPEQPYGEGGFRYGAK